MEVKSVGIFSVAKLTGIYAAFGGFLAGAFFALVSTVGVSFPAGPGAAGGGPAIHLFQGLGLIALVVLPILYGIIGFLAGAINAMIYNICASIVGGIVLNIKPHHMEHIE